MTRTRSLCLLVWPFLAGISFAPRRASADPTAPGEAPATPGVIAPEPRDDFDFMHLLAEHGLHDLEHERWNAYGQATFIASGKAGFHALYTNANGTPNSLSPNAELSFTGTATLFLGLALWPGAEVYFVPEVISERPLSGLVGLGGAIQNFELQKQGSEAPTLYKSRVYLSQTLGFGGGHVDKPSGPSQLATQVDKRRFVLTVGNFSLLDFFDKNTVVGDPRRQFFNMAFLTSAAYDFAADARGYTWGGVAELFYDDWALRVGRAAVPQNPNQLPLDARVYQYFGDQLELQHNHALFGQPGSVKVLGYRNRENTGNFDDAIKAFRDDPSKNATTCRGFSYGSPNASAPDLCWSRKPDFKVGIGLNLEQQLTDDLGVFGRFMYSDGATEVYSYTSADASLSLGFVAKGAPWHRSADVFGLGVGVGWISKSHADYLALGGVDGFIGDGRITPAPETVLEVFYSLHVTKSLWVSADWQHITSPAFNADRGPVDVFSGRIHTEF